MREPGRTGWVRGVLIAAFAAGVLVTGWRGPVRAMFPPAGSQGLGWDFGLVYSLSRAWLIGENPYEMAGVSKAWESGGGPPEGDPSKSRSSGILVYPPTTLVVLAPFGMLPWVLAKWAWLAANLAGVVVMLIGAGRVAGLRGNGLWGLLAGGVWLAPISTNIGVGQTAVVAAGLIVGAYWLRAAREGDDHAGTDRPPPAPSLREGLLLGLATAIKPQMGLLFVVYEIGRLRWKSAAGAAATVALAAAFGALRLENSVAGWLEYWRLNLHNFTTMEDGNPTRANLSMRHHLINLHYPLHNFTDNRELVRWLVYAMVGGLSLAYFVVDLRRDRQRGEGRGELVSLSMTAVVSLLVVYHRFYDAVLLVFPLALGVRMVMEVRLRWAGAAMLALIALFFVPGAVVLAEAAKRGWVPAGPAASWLWQDLILPHEVWAILAMGVILIWVRAKATPGAAPPGVTRRST